MVVHTQFKIHLNTTIFLAETEEYSYKIGRRVDFLILTFQISSAVLMVYQNNCVFTHYGTECIKLCILKFVFSVACHAVC
jgi:hypothetical protein